MKTEEMILLSEDFHAAGVPPSGESIPPVRVSDLSPEQITEAVRAAIKAAKERYRKDGILVRSRENFYSGNFAALPRLDGKTACVQFKGVNIAWVQEGKGMISGNRGTWSCGRIPQDMLNWARDTGLRLVGNE